MESATTALKALYKGEKEHFKDVAEQVKNEFTGKYPGTWHVIVGKQFGSFVSFEVRGIIYFFLGQVGFLIFKHG